MRKNKITEEQKLKFAAELLKPGVKPLDAALLVVGQDKVGVASQMVVEWQNDPSILNEIDRLKLKNPDISKRKKEDVLCELWNIGESPDVEPKDRISALKLFAEISGFVDGSKTVVNNGVMTTNKVMVVKSHGSDSEWETALEAQQYGLINATAQ